MIGLNACLKLLELVNHLSISLTPAISLSESQTSNTMLGNGTRLSFSLYRALGISPKSSSFLLEAPRNKPRLAADNPLRNRHCRIQMSTDLYLALEPSCSPLLPSLLKSIDLDMKPRYSEVKESLIER